MILNWGTGLTRPGRKSSPRIHTMICLNAVDIIFIITDFMGVVTETYIHVILICKLRIAFVRDRQVTTNIIPYKYSHTFVNCSGTQYYVNIFLCYNYSTDLISLILSFNIIFLNTHTTNQVW